MEPGRVEGGLQLVQLVVLFAAPIDQLAGPLQLDVVVLWREIKVEYNEVEKTLRREVHHALTHSHVALAFSLNGQNQHLAVDFVSTDQAGDRHQNAQLHLGGIGRESVGLLDDALRQARQVNVLEVEHNVDGSVTTLDDVHLGDLQRVQRYQVDGGNSGGMLGKGSGDPLE